MTKPGSTTLPLAFTFSPPFHSRWEGEGQAPSHPTDSCLLTTNEVMT